MDEFDFIYQERHQSFQNGAQEGKTVAEQDLLEDIIDEATLFGKEVSLVASQFAQELGAYEAYIDVYRQLGISQKLPVLKYPSLYLESTISLKTCRL
jgi:hypothetical protein